MVEEVIIYYKIQNMKTDKFHCGERASLPKWNTQGRIFKREALQKFLRFYENGSAKKNEVTLPEDWQIIQFDIRKKGNVFFIGNLIVRKKTILESVLAWGK